MKPYIISYAVLVLIGIVFNTISECAGSRINRKHMANIGFILTIIAGGALGVGFCAMDGRSSSAKTGTPEEILRLLDAKDISSGEKWSILTAPGNKEFVTDCDYVVNILKELEDAEIFDEYRPFVSGNKLAEIVKYRNESGIKLYRNIYEEYEEGSVPNERIWSYRVIGREEVEVGIEFS